MGESSFSCCPRVSILERLRPRRSLSRVSEDAQRGPGVREEIHPSASDGISLDAQITKSGRAVAREVRTPHSVSLSVVQADVTRR